MLHDSANSTLSEFTENRLESSIEILETAISLIHKIGEVGGFATSKPPETREQVCAHCSRDTFLRPKQGFVILSDGWSGPNKMRVSACLAASIKAFSLHRLWPLTDPPQIVSISTIHF